ncbi:hypothetical protein [Aquabacterium sp. CECT 9606]|uniref:hypothetical protein n=1 Tax=Aquabacterium sp. CECT 9606 TaxID=2845822 RepID=UPI001E4C60AC|nr:hypothetical protein [Aquabacterium sp. CECT 9606]CAH0353069.1 hypothetical protein AQB9606_03046 [Aquabacterium sp. CECT 9606]
MGLVILPIAFAIGLTWLAGTFFLAYSVWLLLKKFPSGRTLGIFSACIICSLSWYFPNRESIAKRQEFNRLTTDCGWTVIHTTQEVDGIYLESKDASTNVEQFSSLLKNYKIIEYAEEGGRVAQQTQSSTGPSVIKFNSSRTQRYGLSFQSSKFKYFRRDEAVIFDYQTGQKLAVDIQYWPNETPDTWADYALRLLLAGPKPDYCQSTPVALNERVSSVLVPLGMK